MNIEKLCEKLYAADYKEAGGWDNKINTYNAVRSGGKETVKRVINEWAAEEIVPISMMEAKVKAYEEIIKNSNFAPAIISETKTKINIAKEWNQGYDRGYSKGYDQAEENEMVRILKCLASLETLRDEANNLDADLDEVRGINQCIDIVKEVFEVK